jgi:septal ring factor EnvC (AmiA/AmiB activator)
MKNFLLILLVLPVLFSSCENKKQTEQINQLIQEKKKILSDAAVKDSLVNDFLMTINEIESNLAEIKSREKLISSQTAQGQELSKPIRERINEDIRMINELMQSNKNKIAALNRKIKDSDLKIKEFDNMIALANQQLAERDSEILTLKEELAGLNFSIAVLNDTISIIKDQNRALAGVINDKTNELNTAYFIVGERKELIEKKILNKQGGFLGLGKSQKIAGDVDLNEFTEIDIRNLKSIPLGVKKATLMSVHPAGSYELITTEKKVEEIVIKDPALFWQKSRMLVISTEV